MRHRIVHRQCDKTMTRKLLGGWR